MNKNSDKYNIVSGGTFRYEGTTSSTQATVHNK